jgi:hypothetical protein
VINDLDEEPFSKFMNAEAIQTGGKHTASLLSKNDDNIPARVGSIL